MASERVTVHRGSDGESSDICWLRLDGRHLWGGFPKESLAQGCANRLNAAFDEVEREATTKAIRNCAEIVAAGLDRENATKLIGLMDAADQAVSSKSN